MDKEEKTKQYHIKMPNIEGKIGFSISLGKKEFFIGIAVANIEVETVTRKRKVKAFKPTVKSRFVAMS